MIAQGSEGTGQGGTQFNVLPRTPRRTQQPSKCLPGAKASLATSSGAQHAINWPRFQGFYQQTAPTVSYHSTLQHYSGSLLHILWQYQQRTTIPIRTELCHIDNSYYPKAHLTAMHRRKGPRGHGPRLRQGRKQGGIRLLQHGQFAIDLAHLVSLHARRANPTRFALGGFR